MNTLQRTYITADDGTTQLPAAVCVCGRVVMVRADGKSLYTHNSGRGIRCPLSRQPVQWVVTEVTP